MIESKYFSATEQSCSCCNQTLDNQVLIDMLTKARIMANIPFVITSWYRCENHNHNVGGSPTSSHIKGKAVDIQFKNSVETFKIIDALTRAGFRRIGYNAKKKFLHVDIDLDKASPVFFSY